MQFLTFEIATKKTITNFTNCRDVVDIAFPWLRVDTNTSLHGTIHTATCSVIFGR